MSRSQNSVTHLLILVLVFSLAGCAEESKAQPEKAEKEKSEKEKPEKAEKEKPEKAEKKTEREGVPAGWVLYTHKDHGLTVMAPAGSEKSREIRHTDRPLKNFAFQYGLTPNARGQVNVLSVTGTGTVDLKAEMTKTVGQMVSKIVKKLPKIEETTHNGRPALNFSVTAVLGGQTGVIHGRAVIVRPRTFAIVFGMAVVGHESVTRAFVRHVAVK
jgi:hypothetical protein